MTEKEEIERMVSHEDVHALIEMLGSEDCHAQERARYALGRIGKPAVKPLLRSLLLDNNSTVRWRSAEVLGDLKEPKAVAALIRAFEDENSAVVWRAIEALVEIAAPSLPMLSEAAKIEDCDVRWCAKKAMGMIAQNAEAERWEYLQRALHGNELRVEHVDDAWYWQLLEGGNQPQTCVPRIAPG